MNADFLRYKKRYEDYWNKRRTAPTQKVPELYARFLDEEEFLMYQENKRKEDALITYTFVLSVVFLLILLVRIFWKMFHR